MNKLRRMLVVLASLSLLFSLTGILAGGAAAGGKIKDVGLRHTGTDFNSGVGLPFDPHGRADVKNASPPLGPGKIGDTKTWLGLDDTRGVISLKNYTLRGVGTNVEVWVSTNLNFPNTSMLNPLTPNPSDYFTYNDCRNDGVRNVITQDQVDYLISEFDTNMYPIESDWWRTLPNRKGNKAILSKLLGLPQSYYRGEGDNVVVLVDNVRDDNFYDQDNQNTFSYIAGFYYSVFDEYFDRTIMSIDAFDWLHRTGADPLHEPSTDPCDSAPARPFLYEGVFAHEYQHLLHHYTDPDELSWVNEGLSDFTEVITGYADLSKHVDEKGHDSHTQSYLGWKQVFEANWNPIPYDAGPENGLTAWGDQGDGEILADYGAAMYFMNFVDSQGYGQAFFHDWFRNPGNGIDGLNATLAGYGSDDFEGLFSDDIISALVDGYIDNGATVSGDGSTSDFQNDATEATVLLNGEANSTPGAPPWGADYIDLGDGSLLTSIVFDGDDEFAFPGGTDWLVDGSGYWTNPDVGGDAPGNYGDEQDLSMTYDVTGHGGEVLSFDHYYDLEADWDFGFVQVSTDGGASWTSLACDGTSSVHDSAAMPAIVANLPGYSGTAGTSGSPVSATCPALPAGVTHLAFRLMSDWATNADGWHIKNAELDGSALDPTPNDLSDWDNIQFYQPLTLDFGFALVGINGTVDAYGDVTAGTLVKVIRPTLGAGNTYDATGDIAGLSGYSKVVAVVWGIPGDETSTQYQPYSLMVNGAEAADGQ